LYVEAGVDVNFGFWMLPRYPMIDVGNAVSLTSDTDNVPIEVNVTVSSSNGTLEHT
ncbi:unnamed protein product, partial [marine sediment metagenome]